MTADAGTLVPIERGRVARWLPGAVWVATAVTVIVALLIALRDPTPYDLSLPDATAPILVALIASLSSVGALLALRRADNPIGWILLACGVLLAITFAASTYTHASAARGLNLPMTEWVAWLGVVASTPGLALMGIVILIFPTGHLPPRGRPVMALLLVGIVLNTVAGAFRPDLLASDPPIKNPAGIEGIGDALAFAEALGVGLLVIGVVLATASVLGRLRTARGDERKQLLWFAYAAVVVAAALALTVVPTLAEIAWLIALTAFACLPIAIAIAVMKYRLYDIDRLINRTLVYLPLIGILGGLYAACVALFQRLFISFTGDTSDAAVVLTTLIVAGTFTPVRKNLEGAVDRAFKPDGAGTISTSDVSTAAPMPSPSVTLDDPRLAALIEAVAQRVADDTLRAASRNDE